MSDKTEMVAREWIIAFGKWLYTDLSYKPPEQIEEVLEVRAQDFATDLLALLDAERPVVAKLREIGNAIHTQDNRATANPIFAVQQKRRQWHVAPDEGDGYKWINVADDFQEAGDDELPDLEEYYEENYTEPEGWRRTGYVDTWEFVQPFLTEAAAEEYIRINGHNLKEPRIYVYGGWRNAEWAFLRSFFLTYKELTDV